MSEAPRFMFSLNATPVPCARPRVVRQAGRAPRTIMPERTVAFERLVRAAAGAVRPPGWALGARYRLELVVRRARRAGDADNFAKAVLDGLNGVLWRDDALVEQLFVAVVDGETPGIDVRVDQLDESSLAWIAGRWIGTDADAMRPR